MRLLHEIIPDETLLYQGEYRYLRDNEPTGQIEAWQVSRLPDGAQVVRADISSQTGVNPVNLLTHLQRNPDGRPEWLRMRYERGDIVAAAQYTFEKAVVRVARQAEGYPRRQQVIDIAASYEVDYHCVIAHDYVWRGYPRHARGKPWAIPIISPDLWADGTSVLDGRVMRFNVKPLEEETCTVPAGSFENVRHFEIMLDEGVRATAWYDEFGVPLRWYYPDKDYDFVLAVYTHAGEE
jgi:hypothetical protein